MERDSIERPSKIARPSTSTGTFRTSSSPNLPSSSSSSGMWKTGRILPSDKDDNHQAIHRQVREQGIQERVVRRPVTANGLQQDNAVGLGRSADGLSLSSLLDGNNASVASRITADSQTSRYRSNEVQMLGQGQSLRPAFNTPSGIGQTPGFNPRTPRLPPTTSGQQKADRPLTPSTLFLPTSQQSQYFPRQQQQQQQQSRQQQIQQPVIFHNTNKMI